MTLEAYLPVLVQITLAVVIAVSILIASHYLGQRAIPNARSQGPYECGLVMQGPSHARFSVKFYIIAMLFILFDIEVVFLLPWVMSFREALAASLPIMLPGLFFILLLVIGLIYEIRKGGLEWDR